jgi:large subunit ribosomal protein L4e
MKAKETTPGKEAPEKTSGKKAPEKTSGKKAPEKTSGKKAPEKTPGTREQETTSGKKAQVKSLEGSVQKKIDLPEAFSEEFRPDLIKRAVLSLQSRRLQPHGSHPYAGVRTSAHSWGSGRGVSHVPRIKNGSRAARVPQARGGREAHPPVTAEVLVEKINRKEKRKAFLSAVAATGREDLVKARGHRYEGTLPVILVDDLETLENTPDVVAALTAIGVYSDVERARDGRNVRAGRGKMRGRRYKQPRSLLIVTAGEPLRAARNLSGVDAVSVRELNTEHLAPGTHAGRLTVWTEGAVKALGELP